MANKKTTQLTLVESLPDTAKIYAVDEARAVGDQSVQIEKSNLIPADGGAVWNEITGDQKDVNLIGFTDGQFGDIGTFNEVTVTPNQTWQNVVYGNGTFVATTSSNNVVAYSKDLGQTWLQVTLPTTLQVTDIRFLNGFFVIISRNASSPCVYHSTDGITWIPDNGSAPANQLWQSIEYGNGLYVATGVVSLGSVMYSSDLITWVQGTTAENNDWNGLAYGNNIFVAVSGNGTNRVMTSSDGITWTSRVTPNQFEYTKVYFGNGVFLAITREGTSQEAIISADGINWTSSNLDTTGFWLGGGFYNGAFVLIDLLDKVIATSIDGINFDYSTTVPTTNNTPDIAFGGGQTVVITNTGTLTVFVAEVSDTIKFENTVNQYQLNGVNIPIVDKVLNIEVSEGGSTALVEDATVTGTYDIDWTNDTYKLTLTGDTTFTESNLPTSPKSIKIYLQGEFVPTFPVGWDAVTVENYDGTQENEFIVTFIKTADYFVKHKTKYSKNLVYNSGFDNNDAWIRFATTISGGVCNFTNNGDAISQGGIDIQAKSKYLIEFDIVTLDAGSLRLFLNASSSSITQSVQEYTTTGSKSVILEAYKDSGQFKIAKVNAGNASIDNLTCRKLN